MQKMKCEKCPLFYSAFCTQTSTEEFPDLGCLSTVFIGRCGIAIHKIGRALHAMELGTTANKRRNATPKRRSARV
jgi:hypothetical protein